MRDNENIKFLKMMETLTELSAKSMFKNHNLG